MADKALPGLRIKYGETHAATQIEKSDSRTDVTLACGPTLNIDQANKSRFILTEDPLINCYICREKTEQKEADEK